MAGIFQNFLPEVSAVIKVLKASVYNASAKTRRLNSVSHRVPSFVRLGRGKMSVGATFRSYTDWCIWVTGIPSSFRHQKPEVVPLCSLLFSSLLYMVDDVASVRTLDADFNCDAPLSCTCVCAPCLKPPTT